MAEIKSRLVKQICKRLQKILDEESGSIISAMFRHRLVSKVGRLMREFYWLDTELSWFEVICDDSNNTAEILRDEDFRLDVYWKECGYPYIFKTCMGKDGILLRPKGYDEEEEEKPAEEDREDKVMGVLF